MDQPTVMSPIVMLPCLSSFSYCLVLRTYGLDRPSPFLTVPLWAFHKQCTPRGNDLTFSFLRNSLQCFLCWVSKTLLMLLMTFFLGCLSCFAVALLVACILFYTFTSSKPVVWIAPLKAKHVTYHEYRSLMLNVQRCKGLSVNACGM